jgi:hypothetical protein
MKKFEPAGARLYEGEVPHFLRTPTIVGSCGRVGECVGGWVTTHNTYSLLGDRVVVVAQTETYHTLAPLSRNANFPSGFKPSNRSRHQPSNPRITKVHSTVPAKRHEVRWSHRKMISRPAARKGARHTNIAGFDGPIISPKSVASRAFNNATTNKPSHRRSFERTRLARARCSTDGSMI